MALGAAQSVFFDLDRHQVPKELVLHATALIGLMVMLPGWRRVQLTAIDGLLLLTLAWSWASALLAVNHWIGFRAVSIGTSAFVVYRMGRRIAGTPAARLAMAGLVAAVVIAATVGLAESFGFSHPIFATERVPGGTFGNRNFLAHFVVIGLPLVGLMAVTSRRWWSVVAGVLAVVLMVGLIVITRSRAAWLAGLLSGGVLVLAAWGARAWRESLPRARRLGILLAAVTGGVAALIIPNQLEWKSESPYRDTVTGLVDFRTGSGQGRLLQWRNSLQLVPGDPVFGVGPGNWFVHYPRVTAPGDPAFAGYNAVPTNPWPSSDWVAFLTEVGVVGTVLLLLAGGAIGLTALRRTGSDDPAEVGRGLMVLGMMTAGLVTGGFDAVLHLAAPSFLLAAAVGLLVPESGPVMDRPIRAAAARLAGGFAVVVVGLALLLSAGHVAALRATRDARDRAAVTTALRFAPGNHQLHLRLTQSGSCRARIAHARAAQSLLPFHPYPKRALRECGG